MSVKTRLPWRMEIAWYICKGDMLPKYIHFTFRFLIFKKAISAVQGSGLETIERAS